MPHGRAGAFPFSRKLLNTGDPDQGLDVSTTFRATRRVGLGCLIALATVGSWVRSDPQFQVGYTVLAPDSGRVPVATALFSYSNPSGVLVSQAAVAATEPISRGRIFVDQAGAYTGFAFVNPSAQASSLTLVVRDSSGREIGRESLSLAAGEHRSRYVSELFVRRVDATTRIITTVAGTGAYGASGDNGPARTAELRRPTSVALDAAGNLFISDSESHRIRVVRGPVP